MAKKKTAGKWWAIVIVLFMVFSMILFAAGGILASLSGGSASPAASQSSVPPTQVIAYVPPVPASGTVVHAGSCFTNSVAAPYRADAWRCTVGNAIQDPCFMIAGTNNLLCDPDPAHPSASTTVILRLAKPLPNATTTPAAPSNWAWAVLLADGTYCTPFTGTRPFSATGETAYYGCASQNPDEEYIFGDLNDAAAVWTASVGSLSRPAVSSSSVSSTLPVVVGLQDIPVKTVWQ